MYIKIVLFFFLNRKINVAKCDFAHPIIIKNNTVKSYDYYFMSHYKICLKKYSFFIERVLN